MSAIRDYLEAKGALGEREWLRREPRVTHPEILEARFPVRPHRSLFERVAA